MEEVYLWGSESPDTYVDISETLRLKFDSLQKHASQFLNPEGRWERMQNWARQAGEAVDLPFAERFRRLKVDADRCFSEPLPHADKVEVLAR